MNPAELQQPILDGGIRSINFFNGRLLTASDLTREQVANREVDKRLGKAVGEGIAYGFEVSKSLQATNARPVLTIEPGLAINRRGQTLQLATQIDVGLVRQSNGSTSTTPAFSECTPIQTGTYVAGAGMYLLTVAPAETSEGLAVTAGLETGVASCNRDTLVSGLQFRLIQLNPPLTAAELHDENRLRNHVAYRCFGVTRTSAFVADPFAAPIRTYGLLDELRDSLLTDCDVPLAVLYWTSSLGIRFIDLWSARRGLASRFTDDRWSVILSNRRRRENEAMFLQFDHQISDILRTESNLSAVVASDRFEFLPPAGLLPITGTGSSAGFNPAMFLGGLSSRDIATIDGNLLRSLLHQALDHDPIDLSKPDKIQLYLIWENMKAVERGESTQLAMLFASHTLPYSGVARFGSARWNLSRFARAVI
jgi:hypothetical protein